MKIVLSERANRMLQLAAAHSPAQEVGGFGKVERRSDDTIYVSDIYVPPQTVGAAHTNMALNDLEVMTLYALEHGETLADWRLWWHSHGTLGAFSSGQDKNTLEQLATMFGDWAPGLVINSKQETYGWVHIVNPFNVVVEKVEVTVEIEDATELKELITNMMIKVRTQPVVPVHDPRFITQPLSNVPQPALEGWLFNRSKKNKKSKRTGTFVQRQDTLVFDPKTMSEEEIMTHLALLGDA